MRPNRRQFLLSTVAAPAVFAQSRRTNVLFVLADEWRAQSTGYNGDSNVRAPMLDRLAAQSVSFDTAVSGTPVCCPYRASLLTGQYPLTNGVFINDVELKPKGVTMGDAFREAGDRTGWVCNSHLNSSPDVEYGRRLAYIPPEKRFGFEYWKACECTHDYNKSLYYEGNDPTPKYWPSYDAFAQTDDACSFIGAHAKSNDPFCLVLSLGPPHFPLQTAPQEYRAMFEGREIALRENVPPDQRRESAEMHRGYYAHMAALDACFGRLLNALDRARIAEDTIVVFTSDHGDMMLSQGLTTKLHPWDESIRVPFLLRYPQKLGMKRRASAARSMRRTFCRRCSGSPGFAFQTRSRAPIIPPWPSAARSRMPEALPCSACRFRSPKRGGTDLPGIADCARPATRTFAPSTGPGCSTTIRPTRFRCGTWPDGRKRRTCKRG